MITEMQKVRRTVTIDAELDRQLRELTTESLSSFVNRAIEDEIRDIRIQAMLDDINRERRPDEPPPSEEQIKAVRREIAALWLA